MGVKLAHSGGQHRIAPVGCDRFCLDALGAQLGAAMDVGLRDKLAAKHRLAKAILPTPVSASFWDPQLNFPAPAVVTNMIDPTIKPTESPTALFYT